MGSQPVPISPPLRSALAGCFPSPAPTGGTPVDFGLDLSRPLLFSKACPLRGQPPPNWLLDRSPLTDSSYRQLSHSSPRRLACGVSNSEATVQMKLAGVMASRPANRYKSILCKNILYFQIVDLSAFLGHKSSWAQLPPYGGNF